MSAYRVAPEAKGDLDAIWDYIGVEKDRPAAASRQIELLFEKFSLLARQPLLGEVRHDLGPGLRSFVAGRYVVVYRVSGRVVEILRVAHSARDIGRLFGG